MTTLGRTGLATLGLAAITISLGAGPAAAHDGHDHGHGAPRHGGTLVEAEGQHFEAVFNREGLALYPLTPGHTPVDTSGLSGKVAFYHPNAPDRPWFERPLRPAAPGAGGRPEALGVRINLAKAPAEGARAAFEVQGLPRPARLSVPVTFPADGAISVARSTAADRAAVASQKLCPVSDEDLTSMGGPIKIARGGRSVLVCCQGCVDAVKADPDKYLTAAPAGHDHH